MEEAMQQSPVNFAAGDIVKGTIIEVRSKEVLVDIGYKSEGSIPGNEFDDIKTVNAGDVIDVLIERLEDREGMVVLSKEKAEFKQNWEKILSICNEGGTITGRVKGVVKGGLLVNIGVEAFLPASQIDITPPKSLMANPRNRSSPWHLFQHSVLVSGEIPQRHLQSRIEDGHLGDRSVDVGGSCHPKRRRCRRSHAGTCDCRCV